MTSRISVFGREIPELSELNVFRLLCKKLTSEDIAAYFDVQLEEILDLRRRRKILGPPSCKKARTVDYIQLLQPIFYGLSRDEKEEWARKMHISVSQLYRIMKKDLKSEKAKIPKRPRIWKPLKDTHYPVWHAKKKHAAFSNIRLGKRQINTGKESQESVGIRNEFVKASRNTKVVVEPSEGIFVSKEYFEEKWKQYYSSFETYKNFAYLMDYELSKVRHIAHFLLLPIEIPKTLPAMSKALSQFYKYHLCFKKFIRRQKKYSGQETGDYVSIDGICALFNISRATFYRNIGAKQIRHSKRFPLKPTHATMLINGRWYDVDSFVYPYKTHYKQVSFVLP